jgi:ferredoxin-like protein FixX
VRFFETAYCIHRVEVRRYEVHYDDTRLQDAEQVVECGWCLLLCRLRGIAHILWREARQGHRR